MHWLSTGIVFISAVNFVVFATSSVTIFDNRTPDGKWSLFKVTWTVCAAALLWAEWRSPATVWWRAALALALLSSSLALYVISARAVRQHAGKPFTIIFTNDVPEQLVTRGPYAWVRHPFYTAYSLTYLGCASAVGDRLAWVAALGMLGIYVAAARAEERKFVTSELATPYESYRRRTGMFLPRWRRQD